ncbi:MAG: hypothetical protein N3B21_09175 [Clostridia bacterium]|nr:hypothetical protein [Clostridia bacterium]
MYTFGVHHPPYGLYAIRPDNDVILDKKIGDVNGDGIPDTVYLVGNKSVPFQGSFQNIKLIVQDGKTQYNTLLPLYPNYSTGVDATVDFFDFTGDKVNDIFITIPYAKGQGPHYYIFSFANNQIRTLLKPEQFYIMNKELGFEANFKDNYKIEFVSSTLGKKIVLDISHLKESLEGNTYDKNGRLLKPLKGRIETSPRYIPTSAFDETIYHKYGLIMLQPVFGDFAIPVLGFIQSLWEYDLESSRWRLNPFWTGVFKRWRD